MKSVQYLGFVVVVASISAACSPATSGAEGISCNTDGDCSNGFQCLTYVLPEGGADGGCGTFGLECLRPCQSNSDCSSDPSGFVACVIACGGLGTCEPGIPYTPADAGADADATVTEASVAPEASVAADATGAVDSSSSSDATLATDAPAD